MPRRNDISKIMIIGSGPIVIGQACEFDYAGSQALKALKEEGYRVVLVNSNPATVMTDPDMADATYVEPITPEVVEMVMEKERPDALLPTLGGQTALNVAAALARSGTLDRLGVALIGAGLSAIERAENRDLFKRAMAEAGLEVLRSRHVKSVKEALAFAAEVGYPVMVRPSFTLGGSGGGVGLDEKGLREAVSRGIDESPVHQVLVEESVAGWKEFELEVMRDGADNVVIVCSIENVDPMGVHTGDSVTVAPAQTLTDKEYQVMRDLAIRAIRAIGVETGGSNIQFAVDPRTGRMVVIEMNPRVSRSSALASKATGFPIAKIAAKLAVGYTLDEIPNDITRRTPACFEPTVDYCVVKIPRWDFSKFPGAEALLGTEMKSVGEVMAVGRTFPEALQKGLRSLEEGYFGLYLDDVGMQDLLWTVSPAGLPPSERLLWGIRNPNPWRLLFIREALKAGVGVPELHGLSGIDPWFLHKIREIVAFEGHLASKGAVFNTREGRKTELSEIILEAKRLGFSDAQIAAVRRGEAEGPEGDGGNHGQSGPKPLFGESSVRRLREELGVQPTVGVVDTCAGEFEALTPYYFLTYDAESEPQTGLSGSKVMIVGSGPNRIGQGIEFDYCCVEAAMAAREAGYKVIMVNCNPETVSTDYDVSDRLYFEPLTLEDVLNVYEAEEPEGVFLEFGGQTPLKLAMPLCASGVRIMGTPPAMVDAAEDREKCSALVSSLGPHGVRQPLCGTASSPEEAAKVARSVGYPALLRPSYVLGGRAMRIVYCEEELLEALSPLGTLFEKPVLIDAFLEDAVEVDVDAVSDGRDVLVGAVMEHVELAGVHSGDSACVIPPRSLSERALEKIEEQTKVIALAFGVVGLVNLQFAVKGDEVYLLEVNPRASRTVPFASKATGVPLVRVATRVMLGQSLREAVKGIGPLRSYRRLPYYAVKEAVLPFGRFSGTDITLGPEMRSTGEVMGIDGNFGTAFAKSQMAAGAALPTGGAALITVCDRDKPGIVSVARALEGMGFELLATKGTATALRGAGLCVSEVKKIGEGKPDIIDALNGVGLLINTPVGSGPRLDECRMRRAALSRRIPVITTIRAAEAAVEGIRCVREGRLSVKSLQEYMRMKQ